MSDFKTNQDLLEAQQRAFTSGGVLLKNIFSILAAHPVFSLVFLLSFGLLTNALYSVISILVDYAGATPELKMQSILVALFLAILAWIYISIRDLHKDLFKNLPLTQKRVLISLVSNNRTDFKDTPSYNTYQSLLYNPAGHAANNAIQKVVLVVSEAPEVTATATAFKAYIEAGGRSVEIYGITIANKSILEIESQMETLFARLSVAYKPYEIISDYTGGTKDMSIALLRESERSLVLPIYLNAATTTNHSRYS